MRKLLLLFFVFSMSVPHYSSAQKLIRTSINSFGGITNNDNLKLSQTAGQSSVVGSVHSENTKLRQGFQQPITNTILVSNSLNIKVFPNPTQDELNIIIENNRNNNFSYYLTDSQGRICQSEKNYKSSSIQLSNHLSPGVYTIRIVVDNKVGYASIIKTP